MHKIVPHGERGKFYNHPAENHTPHYIRSAVAYVRSWFRRSADIAAMQSWQNLRNGQTQVRPAHRDNSVMWLGHASFLINLGGVSLLVDPVFGPSTVLLPRIIPAALQPHELPPIDAILISHNHPDHFEVPTITELAHKNQCPIFVPVGDKHWFKKSAVIEQVIESTWWDNHAVKNVYVTFLPAHHWSKKSFFAPRNASLWGSWMIHAQDKAIYHAGDTAYGSHFKAIAQEFPRIACALMPIGPCEPHSWMAYSHMNAEQAGKATLDLGASVLVPMHWGTFSLGTDPVLLPIERITAWHAQRQYELTLTTLPVGGVCPLVHTESTLREFRNSYFEKQHVL